MKRLLIISLTLIFGCKSELSEEKLADFNLYLETNHEIDSVLVLDIGQNREVHKVPFKKIIKINFKDSINDLYNIWFKKDGKIVYSPISSSQLWLKGENITIKGKIENKLIIDTIIGSSLNYNVKKHYKEIWNLKKQKKDSSVINKYFFKQLKENIDNVFSLGLANDYAEYNTNNYKNLIKLKEFIANQNKNLKNHSFFSTHEKLIKKIKNRYLLLKDYKFHNMKNEIVDLNLNNNKKYLIDLWFITCAPCISDHKIISKKLEFLENHNIELIGISTDNNKDHSKWNNYLKSNNYNWFNYRELESGKKITSDFGISAFPTYILLNSEGKIEIIFNSFKNMENYINFK